MECDNCGMDHRPKENRLCDGPFVSLSRHLSIVNEVSMAAVWLRNQFKNRMSVLGQKLTDDDVRTLIEAQAVLDKYRR